MRLCRHSAGGGGGVAGIQTCSVVPTSSVKIHSISGTPMGTFRLVALLLFFILFIIFFFGGGGGVIGFYMLAVGGAGGHVLRIKTSGQSTLEAYLYGLRMPGA